MRKIVWDIGENKVELLFRDLIMYRHTAFLVGKDKAYVLTEAFKMDQSEGIPESGILERLPLRMFYRVSIR